MLHDTSQPCRELNSRSGATRRVMAPVLSSLEPGEMWSPCSAHFITDFLDNGHGTTRHRWSQCRGSQYPQGPLVQRCCVPAGQCLLDKPSEWLQLPSVLPGSIYPVLRQCQLAFGPDSRHCGDLQPPCASLWCTGRVSGRSVCQTKHFPWADGTPCAPGRVCMDGLCVGISHMQKLTVSPSGAAWGGWWGGHHLPVAGFDPPIAFSGCRHLWMAAGDHGDRGVGAHGPAVVASSSPTATAPRQHLATVASTVRASAPAFSPAMWKSVLAAPVSGAGGGGGEQGYHWSPAWAVRVAGGCRQC